MRILHGLLNAQYFDWNAILRNQFWFLRHILMFLRATKAKHLIGLLSAELVLMMYQGKNLHNEVMSRLISKLIHVVCFISITRKL